MHSFIKKQPTSRIIVVAFLLTIFIGSAILMLPFSVKEGVTLKYIDALYTSTSAVCVTGLIAVDVGDTFTLFGQIVIALLIQIGGLGITSIGAGIILAIHKKIKLKEHSLISQSMNLTTKKGISKFLKSVFFTTLFFETVGALLCFPVFLQHYSPLKAAWISIFHSIAAFNNAGFDILGGSQSLIPFKNSVILNLVTALLIICGGIGFLVIKELRTKKFRWKKLSMHSKVVLSTSLVLIVGGTLLIKLTENVSWLGAFFLSVSSRTAGFTTYPLGLFTKTGLFVITILMFIGTSPGSTGGGIKTSTLFVLCSSVKSAATGKKEKAFKFSVPESAIKKAAVTAFLSAAIVIIGTFIVCVLEPNLAFMDVFFETISAFSTTGLSTGITQDLSVLSKTVHILIMFIGRLGALTVLSMWTFSPIERTHYPEGNISIG